MTRQGKQKSSAAVCSGGRVRRLAIAAVSALAAFAMVFATAFRPVAYAQTNLVPGQIQGSESATVLVYLNGSDLESYAGEATTDVAEMLDSNVGANVNVLIETLGTSEWQDFGIASDHTQRYRVNQGELELVDDSLGQLDTTSADTLADFISWGTSNYPADRYILVMWDHGAGPVYGFGYDEFQPEEEALTLDEMQQALAANPSVHFDIIGMDCCIMSSLETCMVLQPYCDYAILSEDFEPGVGWSYEGWLSMLEKDPGVEAEKLGGAIVDDMVAAVAEDEENGEATLALIDESAVDELYKAWVDFAYANEDELLGTNYSQEIEWYGRMGDQDEQRAHGSSGHNGHGPGHAGYDDGDAWGGYGTEDSLEDGYGWSEYGTWGNDDDRYDLGAYDNWNGFEDAYGMWAGSEGEYSGSCSCGCSCCDGMGMWDDWNYDGSYVTMTDYFITDIEEVAASIDGDEATALRAAMDNAIAHYAATSGEEGMGGIGVTLPYGDAEFYDQMTKVFTACGIDRTYIEWLEAFVDVSA